MPDLATLVRARLLVRATIGGSEPNGQWDKSISRIGEDRRILTRGIDAVRHDRSVRFGAANLFLCAAPFRNGIHLHLQFDGAAAVRAANAAGNDSRDRNGATEISCFGGGQQIV